MNGPAQGSHGNGGKVAAAAVIIIILLVSIFVAFQVYRSRSPGTSASLSTSQTLQSSSSTLASLSSQTTSSTGATNQGFEPPNPNFIDGRANVSEPPDYPILEQFTLNLINNDRNQNGVSNVTLSAVQSGQQHADSLSYSARSAIGTFRVTSPT